MSRPQFASSETFLNSVKEAQSKPRDSSSDSHATLNTRRIAPEKNFGYPPKRITASVKSNGGSKARSSPITRSVRKGRAAFSTVTTNGGAAAYPRRKNSISIGDWFFTHSVAAPQNLSSDELMFVSHIYVWGLIEARRRAAKFHYKLQKPLPELLAALSELDKNYNARNAARMRPSNSPVSSRKRSSGG